MRVSFSVLEHANVQPHSGAQANTAVYFAMLNPGDTVMGMNLNEGGHLTHGSPVNISGKYFNFVPYGVDPETHRIDYDKVLEIAKECKPKMIVAGASAYPRIIDFAKLREIADAVGAYLMVDMAHIAGLVAAGVHPNPVPYCEFVTTTTHKTLRGPRGGLILCREEFAKQIDKAIFPGTQGGPLMHVIAAKAVVSRKLLTQVSRSMLNRLLRMQRYLLTDLLKNGFDIVSGGTDNHLMLVDLRPMHITGKELEARLDEVRITCNKNAIPFDPEKPGTASGIRLGTPAVTTRGMVEEDMVEIADLIAMVAKDFEGNKAEVAERVQKLVAKYPIYE